MSILFDDPEINKKYYIIDLESHDLEIKRLKLNAITTNNIVNTPQYKYSLFFENDFCIDVYSVIDKLGFNSTGNILVDASLKNLVNLLRKHIDDDINKDTSLDIDYEKLEKQYSDYIKNNPEYLI
jgi:hypothetical protein